MAVIDAREHRAVAPAAAPIAALFPVTKFLPPPGRAEHVARARCLATLAGPPEGRHLLISASAGAGKSTLAAQWAAGIGSTAWVSLGPEDNAPGQLWAAVISSLQTISPELGAAALPALLGGGDTGSVLVHLIGDLVAHGAPVALVLDDLHLVADPACHREVEWFLDHCPPTVRVCLCTRADPDIRIPRLVARGLLAEVRNSELAFDSAETYEFMHDRLALELDEATAEHLSARVDGWAAGLYLAALSLRAGVPADELFASLEAGDRRVREYISSQTLSRLDERTQELLEGLALLPRFCAELCDHVFERTDMDAVLTDLDASNLFVIPLDRAGRWFRLHHLFAKVLADRAQLRDPARVAELHRRAAGWHREHGDVGEAIDHHVAARDFEPAADLIAASVPVQINLSRLGGHLARWLSLLPRELVAERASLCLAGGWVAAINSRRDEAEQWLVRALARPHDGPLPSGSASAAAEAALIQATFCFKDYGSGRRHSHDAVALESPDSPWQPLVQLMYGWYAHHAGDHAAALAAYRRSEELATNDVQIASLVIAPALAALVHLELGDRHAADAAVRRSAQARRHAGVESVPQMLNSWFGTARAQRLLGRLDDAARDAEWAATIAADYPAATDSLLIAVPVTIELALIRAAQGDLPGARQALEDARVRLDGAVDPGRIGEWLAEAEREVGGAAAAGTDAAPAGAADTGPGGALSRRELTVLAMLAGDASLREIAAELFVSPNTMKTHCRTIYRKLGVGSRGEAVALARRRALLA
jgi:LuxR family maltose regulon positive regulatory protein